MLKPSIEDETIPTTKPKSIRSRKAFCPPRSASLSASNRMMSEACWTVNSPTGVDSPRTRRPSCLPAITTCVAARPYGFLQQCDPLHQSGGGRASSLIFEPFRAARSDTRLPRRFLAEFMRGRRELTLGSYMIILSSAVKLRCVVCRPHCQRC